MSDTATPPPDHPRPTGELTAPLRGQKTCYLSDLREAADRLDALEAAVERPTGELGDLREVINALEAERDFYKSACEKQSHEVEQILGAALGYPRYCDDQANFPGATPADGVCVGEHTCGSIAEQAAGRVAKLMRERDAIFRCVCELRAIVEGGIQ